LEVWRSFGDFEAVIKIYLELIDRWNGDIADESQSSFDSDEGWESWSGGIIAAVINQIFHHYRCIIVVVWISDWSWVGHCQREDRDVCTSSQKGVRVERTSTRSRKSWKSEIVDSESVSSLRSDLKVVGCRCNGSSDRQRQNTDWNAVTESRTIGGDGLTDNFDTVTNAVSVGENDCRVLSDVWLDAISDSLEERESDVVSVLGAKVCAFDHRIVGEVDERSDGLWSGENANELFGVSAIISDDVSAGEGGAGVVLFVVDDGASEVDARVGDVQSAHVVRCRVYIFVSCANWKSH